MAPPTITSYSVGYNARTAHAILREYWGFDRFRPLQEDVIKNVVEGRDTMALMPTGGGKSLCYQMAGMLRGGVTIVISPLIALMKDQVETLNDRGITATYVNSLLGYREVDSRLNAVMAGEYKFLYLSPERLNSDLILARIGKMDVRTLVVDEAHCISQWGFNFRPPYRQIGAFRQLLKNVPVIAVTATSTPIVTEDIQSQLQMRDLAIYRQSFVRNNIRYVVLYDEDKWAKLLEIVTKVRGSAIVYTRSRKEAETLAQKLKRAGQSAMPYHAGMETGLRHRIQEDWMYNRTRIVVATNAFGMGVDKSDVRLVVHYQMPVDLESYYQEAGRAGRDGKVSFAIALFSPDEAESMRYAYRQAHPTWDEVREVYETVCDACGVDNRTAPQINFPLDAAKWAQNAEVSAQLVVSVLQILHEARLLALFHKPDNYPTVQMVVNGGDIIRFRESHFAYDALLDFLLRDIGGEVFQTPCRLETYRFSRGLRLSWEQIETQLMKLAEFGLLVYRPAGAPSGLVFLQPRTKLTQGFLNWEIYEMLARRSEERLQRALAYASSKETCRSQLILNYFHEYGSAKCGVCDNCLGRHNPETSGEAQQNKIIEEILNKLQRGALRQPDLVRVLTQGNPPQRERVIRKLLQEQRLRLTDDYRLQIG